MGHGPKWIWGEWKVWKQRFFPAIFQLEESCVECSGLRKGVGVGWREGGAS